MISGQLSTISIAAATMGWLPYRLLRHQSMLLISSSSNWQMLKSASDQRHWSAILTTGDAQLMPWRWRHRHRRAGRAGQTGRGGYAIRPVGPADRRPPALTSAPDRSRAEHFKVVVFDHRPHRRPTSETTRGLAFRKVHFISLFRFSLSLLLHGSRAVIAPNRKKTFCLIQTDSYEKRSKEILSSYTQHFGGFPRFSHLTFFYR